MNITLTKLEQAGGALILKASATLAERRTLALHLIGLRAQDHAIVADEVMESGQATGEIRVIHYLTCTKCKEDNYGRQMGKIQG